MTWHTVVNDLKFARAVVRLEEGGASVREVAEDLEYSFPAHFSRFFQLRAGLPPSDYREELGRVREPLGDSGSR